MKTFKTMPPGLLLAAWLLVAVVVAAPSPAAAAPLFPSPGAASPLFSPSQVPTADAECGTFFDPARASAVIVNLCDPIAASTNNTFYLSSWGNTIANSANNVPLDDAPGSVVYGYGLRDGRGSAVITFGLTTSGLVNVKIDIASNDTSAGFRVPSFVNTFMSSLYLQADGVDKLTDTFASQGQGAASAVLNTTAGSLTVSWQQLTAPPAANASSPTVLNLTASFQLRYPCGAPPSPSAACCQNNATLDPSTFGSFLPQGTPCTTGAVRGAAADNPCATTKGVCTGNSSTCAAVTTTTSSSNLPNGTPCTFTIDGPRKPFSVDPSADGYVIAGLLPPSPFGPVATCAGVCSDGMCVLQRGLFDLLKCCSLTPLHPGAPRNYCWRPF